MKIGLLKLNTLWPFMRTNVEKVLRTSKTIIVPEMNLGQLAYEVERMVGRKKVRRVTRANGEMVTPQMVLDALEG